MVAAAITMASSPSEIALQAAYQGDLSLLKKMAMEVDLQGVKDTEGRNTLHLAASKGCLESCIFLLETCGIDVNSLSTSGETPIYYAALNGDIQLVKYLLDHGGDPAMPNEKGCTPLHAAAQEGHCEAIKLLLSRGLPVDTVDQQDGTPLHAALGKDKAEAVKVLLEHGADPNKKQVLFTPLARAVDERSLKCMELLIEAGADLNAHCSFGPTALTHAIFHDSLDCLKLLIEAGADPNVPDTHGNIPFEMAAFCGHRDLLEVLFYGTKPDPEVPDWSVDGIMRAFNQNAASVDERIAAWKSQGKEAYAKEDYRTAISFFGKVLDIHPTDAAMYANQSICWLRMRHGDKALEVARKCRKMQPRWPKAWYREGVALSFMKDYEGAADAFREALQVDPNNEEIKEELRKAEKAVEDPQRVGKISKG